MYNSGAIDRFKSKSDFIYLSSTDRKKRQQLMRLQSQTVTVRAPQELNPQTVVYVLVEYIKNPQSSFYELSNAVVKR